MLKLPAKWGMREDGDRERWRGRWRGRWRKRGEGERFIEFDMRYCKIRAFFHMATYIRGLVLPGTQWSYKKWSQSYHRIYHHRFIFLSFGYPEPRESYICSFFLSSSVIKLLYLIITILRQVIF